MPGHLCPQCGALLATDAFLCDSCGAAVLRKVSERSGSAAASPPSRPDRRTAIVAAIAMAVVLVGVVVGVTWAREAVTTPSHAVTISGTSWQVDYLGTVTGYLGASPVTSCPRCPLSEPVGGTFDLTVEFTNHDATTTHSIVGVDLTFQDGFTLHRTTPALAVPIPPGGTLALTLNLTGPSTAGVFVLTGGVVTQ
jgi:hypothetical protein